MASRQQLLVLHMSLRATARRYSPAESGVGRAQIGYPPLDLTGDVQRIASQIEREVVDALGAGFAGQADIGIRSPGGNLSATIVVTRQGRRPPTGAVRREIEEIVRTTSEAVVRQVCRLRQPTTDWLITADTWSSSLLERRPPGRPAGTLLPRWASAVLLLATAAATFLATSERVASGLTSSNRLALSEPDGKTPPPDIVPEKRPDAAELTLPEQYDLYRRAIYDAAVRRPRPVRLATIDPHQPSLRMMRLADRHPGQNCKTNDVGQCVAAKPIWTSLPAELLAQCRGRPDALLRLKQVLGMPPEADPNARDRWALYELEIRAKDLQRPCVGEFDADRRVCGRDQSEDTALHTMLFRQIWEAYQIDDRTPGYPFTGMGWTYDWSPDSRTHVGVTEFLVKKDAPFTVKQRYTPEEFCGPPI